MWFWTASATRPSRVCFFATTFRMICPSIGEMSGTGRPVTSATFAASSGRIAQTARARSSARRVRSRRETKVRRSRPRSWRASVTSRSISGMVAIASLDSEVNGTFVEATWTRIKSGPWGRPAWERP